MLEGMGNPFLSLADGGSCLDCTHCYGVRTDQQGVRALCSKLVGQPEFWNYRTGCRYWTARLGEFGTDGAKMAFSGDPSDPCAQ